MATFQADVTVDLKPDVTDAEGRNTLKALRLLGFDEVEDVRAAQQFEITLEADDAEAARDRVEEMCHRLLANPVVHDYAIEVG